MRKDSHSARRRLRDSVAVSRAYLYAALILPALVGTVQAEDDLAALGRLLFFDVNLSLTRNQSCASCHDPEYAFSDARDNAVAGAASRGDDGRALGDRNTPSIAYAALVPTFERTPDGAFRGGLFHDGRAHDLVDQAGQPILNPIEMAMPDRAAVIARLRALPHYVSLFEGTFGAGILDDDERAYAALTRALAAFEQGAPFLSFDSRYDRYLRGEYTMTLEEDLGRRLYFSDLTNCMSCHLLRRSNADPAEPFTDYSYHNIGIPKNTAVRAANGLGDTHVDRGLGANPAVHEATAEGRFRTPSLRNIAVTAPYMHNGVFKHLETAIHFYNQYIVRNRAVSLNPETGAVWDPPEVAENISLDLLRQGQPLDEARIAALVAFLKTLTDRRYEPLLDISEDHATAAAAE